MFYPPKRSLFLPAHLVRGLSFAGTMPLMGAGPAGPSGYNPAKYGAGSLFLDSRLIVGDNFDPVPSWADTSGNGNNAAEATNPPTLLHSGQNGFQRVAFDGNNDKLQFPDLTLSGAFTIATITSQTVVASGDAFFGYEGGTTVYLTASNNTTTNIYIGGLNGFTHGARGTGARIDTFTRNGSNTLRHYLDGVESTGSTTASGDLLLDTIAARWNGASFVGFGSMSFYIINIWPSLVSDIGGLVADLKSEFAIS